MDTIKTETTRTTNAEKFLALLRSKMATGPKKITTRGLARKLNINEDSMYALFRAPFQGERAPKWLDGDFTRSQCAWIEGVIVYMKFSKIDISEILTTLSSEQIDSIFKRGDLYLKENCTDYLNTEDFSLEQARNIIVTLHDIQSLLAFVKMTSRHVSLQDCIKFIMTVKKS